MNIFNNRTFQEYNVQLLFNDYSYDFIEIYYAMQTTETQAMFDVLLRIRLYEYQSALSS